MPLALLFHYLILNMFRMLIRPSSGACYLCVELFHGLYCSGSMCVGVTLWFGWDVVVSVCRLKHCFSLHTDTTPSSWSLFIQLYSDSRPFDLNSNQASPEHEGNSCQGRLAIKWKIFKSFNLNGTKVYSIMFILFT